MTQEAGLEFEKPDLTDQLDMTYEAIVRKARNEAFEEAADYVSSQAQIAGEFGKSDSADELSWIAAQIRSRISEKGVENGQ